MAIDYVKDALTAIKQEIKVLQQALETLEKLQGMRGVHGPVAQSPVAQSSDMDADDWVPVSPRKRGPGRKSMGPEERKRVSDRMKEYWAKVRKGGTSDEMPKLQ